MTLRSELADQVLTLRLDRPKRLNAIDEATAQALLDALRRAEESSDVRVVVHGWVVGAGVEWMLDADIVVAARSARFKLPEIGLGVFVTGGITSTLPRYAGLARAKGLLLLGEEFSAADALLWGLVWSVVDDAALDAEVARIAARLAGFEPNAMCRFKRVLNAIELDRFEVALQTEARMQTELEALAAGAKKGKRSRA